MMAKKKMEWSKLTSTGRPIIEPSADQRAAAQEMVGMWQAFMDSGMDSDEAMKMVGIMMATSIENLDEDDV